MARKGEKKKSAGSVASLPYSAFFTAPLKTILFNLSLQIRHKQCLKSHQPPLISGYCFGNYLFVSFFPQAVSEILVSFPVLRFNVSTSLHVFALCAAVSSASILQTLECHQHLFLTFQLCPQHRGSSLQKGRFKRCSYPERLSYQAEEALTGFFHGLNNKVVM